MIKCDFTSYLVDRDRHLTRTKYVPGFTGGKRQQCFIPKRVKFYPLA